MDGMFLLTSVVLWIFIIRWFIKRFKSLPIEKQNEPATPYAYCKKSSIMTQVELVFYKRLQEIFSQNFEIVPQAQLSSFLSHKIKGQNWRGALATIQRKSVDYLICKKENFEPVVVIELDDNTHDSDDRRVRDKLVDEVCDKAELPIVHVRGFTELTNQEIKQQIVKKLSG